jgi:hypothetical protein
MSIPTVNSQEFLDAFQQGDYPAMVNIADRFAQSLALDAAHDMVVLAHIEHNLLDQQQEEYERNIPDPIYA